MEKDIVYLADEPFYTFQGEGPYIGHESIFIRFWGCNKKCTWCDTKYSWETTTDRTPYEYQTIIDYIDKHPHALIVLTGGEPILQKKTILRLCEDRRSRKFQVETNGSLPIDSLIYLENLVFIVSPKLLSSGNKEKYKSEVVRQYDNQPDTCFKFVVADSNKNEIDQFILEHKLTSDVYAMPEGRTAEEVMLHTKEIWEWALVRGIRLTTRLHILAFGPKRLV